MGLGNYLRGNRLTPRFLDSVTPPRVNAIDRILLYDFDTGRADLLQRHIEGLQPRAAGGAEVTISPFESSSTGLAAAYGILSGDFEVVEDP